MNLINALTRGKRSVHPTGGEELTQQHMKEETDINTIVSQYMRNNLLPLVNREPLFGEVPSQDFHEMQNQIADINQAFESLPSKIRNRFENSPYQLLRFVENPANLEESIKLGLVTDPREPEDVLPVQPASAPVADGKTVVPPDPEAQPSRKP